MSTNIKQITNSMLQSLSQKYYLTLIINMNWLATVAPNIQNLQDLMFSHRCCWKLRVFYDVMLCQVYVAPVISKDSCSLFQTSSPWRWMWYDPYKCRELHIQRQSVPSQKIGIFYLILVSYLNVTFPALPEPERLPALSLRTLKTWFVGTSIHLTWALISWATGTQRSGWCFTWTLMRTLFLLTVVPCILIQSKSFFYQLMHNRVALKEY